LGGAADSFEGGSSFLELASAPDASALEIRHAEIINGARLNMN